jgi:hypothetical protein
MGEIEQQLGAAIVVIRLDTCAGLLGETVARSLLHLNGVDGTFVAVWKRHIIRW